MTALGLLTNAVEREASSRTPAPWSSQSALTIGGGWSLLTAIEFRQELLGRPPGTFAFAASIIDRRGDPSLRRVLPAANLVAALESPRLER